MRRETDVLNPWDTSSSGSPSTMGSRNGSTFVADVHLGSSTHFPAAVLSENDVIDPFADDRMSARERELTQAVRAATAGMARCIQNGRGILRYQLRLAPTRVRRGRGASCLTRALRGVSLRGSGTYELALNFRGETPLGAYVIDRETRRPPRPAETTSPTHPPQPRMACAAPAVDGTRRRGRFAVESGETDEMTKFVPGV